ncbi:MAG: DUF2807 domain-containing protein [Flavobacteriaceae bacterium]|nr:DUF2807 domain-containing protein [Flavobacteriaceae bacterium]
MKNILKITSILFLIYGCDSEDTGDCFQKSGTIIQQEFTVDSFNKILIHEGVELIIKEGDIQKVTVETGKNLLNDVTVEVVNNELIAINNNKCNFVRDYNLTKVYVTSPNIVEIRNSSQRPVSSDGMLTYPTLNLLAENHQSDYLNVGDFHIQVANNNISVSSNGIANFYLSGSTNDLSVGFYASDSRFEGKDLIANNVTIIHKSSNNILVYPVDKISGGIYSYGDVLVFNKPPIVEVTEHFKGRLIFK